MDQLLADVTNIKNAKTGQEVVLIGRQKDKAISAEELARLAGTIPLRDSLQLRPAHTTSIQEELSGPADQAQGVEG